MLLKYVKAKAFSEKMKKVKGVINIQPPPPTLPSSPNLTSKTLNPIRPGVVVG